MVMNELEVRLQRRLLKVQDRQRSKQKAMYELAKSFGFKPLEAGVLQNWSEDDIRTLARQRGYLTPTDQG